MGRSLISPVTHGPCLVMLATPQSRCLRSELLVLALPLVITMTFTCHGLIERHFRSAHGRDEIGFEMEMLTSVDTRGAQIVGKSIRGVLSMGITALDRRGDPIRLYHLGCDIRTSQHVGHSLGERRRGLAHAEHVVCHGLVGGLDSP